RDKLELRGSSTVRGPGHDTHVTQPAGTTADSSRRWGLEAAGGRLSAVDPRLAVPPRSARMRRGRPNAGDLARGHARAAAVPAQSAGGGVSELAAKDHRAPAAELCTLEALPAASKRGFHVSRTTQ